MKARSGIALAFLLLAGCSKPGLRFEITVPDLESPLTGRVFVIVTDRDPDALPMHTTGGDGARGVPIWGVNVENLAPGEAAVVDGSTFGFPHESLADLPPGEYRVQAVVVPYAEFRRSDGHVLRLHDDRWEGQQPFRSEGTFYSDVQTLGVEPGMSRTVKLAASNVVGPAEVPADTRYVKRVKFRSEMLSAFWGRDIFLGATVLLPEGYDEHPGVTYPVIHQHGHFSLRPPMGFAEPPTDGSEDRRSEAAIAFHAYWTGPDAPRFIGVTFQHPTPWYDDSYFVNSPNVGPYRDALMQELIPYLEANFRMKPEPWARILTGGSTGGWIALGLQVFEPEAFGGALALCPDPVDFRDYELIDIYSDENAYWTEYEGIRSEIPEAREVDGTPRYTVRQTMYYEQALGDRHRSGRQWAIWEAAYGPIGEDGYPAPLWDWRTGEIDHAVAEAWRAFDLRHVLETNWSALGPKLVGKLHVWTGEDDTYFLENATIRLEEFLESTTEPYYAGSFTYGARQPHCWGPRGRELVETAEAQVRRIAPAGADLRSWQY